MTVVNNSTLDHSFLTQMEQNLPHFVDTTPVELPTNPRFLIVKLWAIGDIMMATPILRALKGYYPGCYVAWVVDSRYSSILDGNPLIDEVIALDAKSWLGHFRRGNLPAYLRTSMSLRRRLMAGRFDCVINLTAEKWWSIWFQCAPKSIGLFPGPDPGYIKRLYTKVIPRSQDIWLHNTEHYILPAAALGVPGPFNRQMLLPSAESGNEIIADFLAENVMFRPGLPLIVLHPGTSQQSKCWPAQNFAQLADELLPTNNVVISGSIDEVELVNSICGLVRNTELLPIVAAGVLQDLREMAALIAAADVVVTGDTSVLHMSSASDTPFVAIYGSTRPDDNAPLYGQKLIIYNEKASCSPCRKSDCPLKGEEWMVCMTAIKPETVLEQVLKLLPLK